MLINTEARTAITEAREEALIELTSTAAQTALRPLDTTTAHNLCDLAREILQIAGQPVR